MYLYCLAFSLETQVVVILALPRSLVVVHMSLLKQSQCESPFHIQFYTEPMRTETNHDSVSLLHEQHVCFKCSNIYFLFHQWMSGFSFLLVSLISRP